MRARGGRRLLEASILRDGFVHGDFAPADLEGGDPELDRERVRNAEHFRDRVRSAGTWPKGA